MNKILIILERFLRFLTSFLVIVMAARLFDKESLGIYLATFSLISIVQVLVDYGTQTYLVRECSESLEHAKERNILFSSIIIKLLIAVAVFVIFMSITLLFNIDIDNMFYIFYLAVLINSFNVFDPVMISKSDGAGLFLCRILSIVISFSFRLYAAFVLNDIYIFAIAIFIEYSIFFILGYVRIHKLKLLKIHFSYDGIKTILVNAFPLAMSSLLIIAYTRLDQLMIAKLLGVEALADYAIGIRFTEASTFIPTVLASAFLPSLILAAKESNFKLVYTSFCRLITIISLVLAFFLFIFADLLINSFFGNDFENSVEVMKISSISLIFSFQAILTSQWFTVFRKDKNRLKRSFYGLIINIILNVILIPLYGVNGACYATLISQFYVGIVSSWIPNKLDVTRYQLGIFKR